MTTVTFDIDLNTSLTDLSNTILRLNLSFPSTAIPVSVSVVGGSLLNATPLLVTDVVLKITELVNENITVILTSADESIADAVLTFISLRPRSQSTIAPIYKKYEPLHNFYDGTGSLTSDENYNSPFRTTLLGFNESSEIDIKLQPSYDDTMNIILSDDSNPIRIINSRFSVDDALNYATLGDRRQAKDSNTYNEPEFYRTRLFPTYKSVPLLTFNGVVDGGQLYGGGYRYFFKYVTQDGDETDIIEESRLVEIHYGDVSYSAYGADSDERTSKAVSFTLSNLDTAFYGIRVYYTFGVGEQSLVTTAHMLSNLFLIQSDGTVNILHTGYESKTDIDKNILNLTYAGITKGKTLSSANNRLLIANTESELTYDSSLAALAFSVPIKEGTFEIKYDRTIDQPASPQTENYSNPDFTYNKLGYWKGETYEIGVVYVGENGVSPVYPLHGLDWLGGAKEATEPPYNSQDLGKSNKFTGAFKQNSYGAYRTKFYADYFETENDITTFTGTKLMVNVLPLLGYGTSLQYAAVTSDQKLAVLYNPDNTTYYLFGKVLTTAVSGVEYAVTFGSVPQPASPVVFNFTNDDGTEGQLTLDTELTVTSDFITPGTDLTSQVGPPRSFDKYFGFFFVRKARKRDMLLDGLVVPVSALPTQTTYTFERSITSLATYNGVGITSKNVGENVTYTPSPGCLFPLGIERIYSRDIIMQAPIKDFTASERLAMYSPDIDTAPSYYSSLLNGASRGVKIDTRKLYNTYAEETNTVSGSHPIPYAIEFFNKIMSSPDLKEASFKARYIEDVSSGTAAKSFSAKRDRNGSVLFSVNDSYPAIVNILSYTDPNILNNPFDTESVTVGDLPGNVWYEDGPSKGYADVLPNKLPSSAVSYGRYIGLELVDGNFSNFSGLNMQEISIIGHYNVNVQTTNYTTNVGSDNYKVEGYFDDLGPYSITVENGVVSNFDPALKAGDLIRIATTYYVFASPLLYPVPADGTYAAYKVPRQQSFAYKAFMFDSEASSHITPSSWATRYQAEDDVSYFAISRRFSIDEFVPAYDAVITGTIDHNIDLYGGDCYLGLHWKQVWYPLGIEEAPQVVDPEAYHLDRRSLGLLPYGLALPVPAQSNTNFHLRTAERKSEAEYEIYGKDRLFPPVKSEIRGSRQKDTSTFNFGYTSSNMSDSTYFKLDPNTPYLKTSYSNRVYASEAQENTGFSNGFSLFKGLNYKDYNNDLGPITKIVTTNDRTYLIFRSGIALIGVDERSFIPGQEQSSNIFVDNVEVLSNTSRVISNIFGSAHIHSILATDSYIYGVDQSTYKIWRLSGTKLEVLSNLRVQSLLTEILQNNREQTDIFSNKNHDIYTSYDSVKNDVYFTFIVRDTVSGVVTSRTLVYNELLQLWITETDDDRKFFFNSIGDRFAFSASTDKETFYFYDNNNHGSTGNLHGVYNSFFGVTYPSSFTLRVTEDLSTNKKLENLVIYGDTNIPISVQYNSDTDTESNLVQNLKPSTNIAYQIPTRTVTGTINNQFITADEAITLPHYKGSLKSGDFISLTDNASNKEYFTVMNLDADDPKKIWLDKPLEASVTAKALTYGYKSSIRVSDAIKELGLVKIVPSIVPDKSISKYRPEGKWFAIKFTFDGNYKLDINSVLSIYNIDNS